MNRAMKKWLVLIAGWAFLLVGFVGLFLPVLQGILFILIGLVILSAEYTWAHHLLERLKARFPHVAQNVDRARHFMENRLSRFRRHVPASNDSTNSSQPFQAKENTGEMP